MKASPILTVNSGSTSVKLGLRSADPSAAPLVARKLERRGSGPFDARRELGALVTQAGGRISAVAHRVVHGGAGRSEPALIDDALEAEIDALGALAPLHNPPALEWIRAARASLDPEIPQIAVFDTAFFAGLPRVAASYAIPGELALHGVRRYGFHGLAHCAMWETWRDLVARPGSSPGTLGNPSAGADDTESLAASDRSRVITLQLGGGCSIAAIRGGAPIDTSMGFSPLEGLVMETRSGDIDPAVVPFLAQKLNVPASEIVAKLNHESGLRGIAGIAGGMRAVTAADSDEARFAIDLFCYRIRKYIGAYFAALGGCDAILFGGGIGEHETGVRERVLTGMDWSGLRLDAALNRETRADARRISVAGGSLEVWVIPVDEEGVLARAALPFLERPQGGSQGAVGTL